MKKSIKIVGAFDRYNYGDLLFPIVIEKYIETYRPDILRDYKIEFYGLVESDLAYVGGKTTKALKDIYDCDYEANSIIIVAGGDVIPSRIGNLDIDLSSSNMNMIFKKILRKILSIKKFEELSMKKFGINNVFPWIIDREKFKKNIFIAYNAVGSSTLDTLKDKAEISYIKKSLSKSNYISTRDSKSLNNIKDLSPKLYPDSATIMSYFFTLEYLEERIREEIKNKINKSSNGYICVQSNLFSIRGREKVLAKEVEKICNRDDLRLVLLPIGFAANHDDNFALKRLKKYINLDTIYFEELNIYEIMYIIAKSNFFAGTSLHGNITAMSYGVRHIGLNKEITKLDEYLKTWDLELQNHCINFEDLSEEYEKIKSINDEDLISKKNELINLNLSNMKNIFGLLEDVYNE